MTARAPLRSAAIVGLLTVTACGESTIPTQPEAGTLESQSASSVAASSPWTRTLPMLRARKFAAAATIGNTIYVVGGLNSTNAEFATLQAYNVATNTWTMLQPMPAARAQTNGLSVVNGRLYITGGYGRSTLFVYNPATNTWTRKRDMPTLGFEGAQAAIGGFLYVYVGATFGLTPRGQALYRYNPTTNWWVTLKSPPTVHASAAAGVIGGNFYLAGGQDDNYNTPGTLEVYNPATNAWTSRAPIPHHWVETASAVLGGKLFVAGGNLGGLGSPRADFDVYDPVTNSWSTKASLPVARAGAAGAAANGRFFVIGGEFDDGTTTGQVLAYTP